MKLFTKICLMLSLICGCIGVVCFCSGIALGSGIEEVKAMADAGDLNIGSWHIGSFGFYYNPFENGLNFTRIIKGSVKKSFAKDEITDLEIDIKYGKVRVIDSDTDEITINVDAPRRNAYECSNNGGTLELLDDTLSYYWKHGARQDVEVTIAIPAGKTFETVDLTTDYGMIEIEHTILAKNVEIELGAGELQAEKITAESDFSVDVGAGNLVVDQFDTKMLEIDCGVGRAKLNGKVQKDVDASCGVGQITLKLIGKEEAYDYTVNCGLGVTSINNKKYSSLSDDKEIDNHAGNEINLDCGIGEITLTVKEE